MWTILTLQHPQLFMTLTLGLIILQSDFFSLLHFLVAWLLYNLYNKMSIRQSVLLWGKWNFLGCYLR